LPLSSPHGPLDRGAEPAGRRPLDLGHLDPVRYLEDDRSGRGVALRDVDLAVGEVGVDGDAVDVGVVGLPAGAR